MINDHGHLQVHELRLLKERGTKQLVLDLRNSWTHVFADVDVLFLEQVIKLRNKFARTSSIVSINILTT